MPAQKTSNRFIFGGTLADGHVDGAHQPTASHASPHHAVCTGPDLQNLVRGGIDPFDFISTVRKIADILRDYELQLSPRSLYYFQAVPNSSLVPRPHYSFPALWNSSRFSSRQLLHFSPSSTSTFIQVSTKAVDLEMLVFAEKLVCEVLFACFKVWRWRSYGSLHRHFQWFRVYNGLGCGIRGCMRCC